MTAPRVAVLDYGIGNLRSAQKTLERAGADPVLTSDAAEVADAAGVVLPGVGAFGRVMEAIRSTGVDEIAHAVVAAGTPFMGICVGMQALYESSEENPELAKLVAGQLLDNALISAGLLDDARGTVRRMNELMERALG